MRKSRFLGWLFGVFIIATVFFSYSLSAVNYKYNRSYAYVQTTFGSTIYTKSHISESSFDNEEDVWDTDEFGLHGAGDFAISLALGYYFNKTGTSLEFEFGNTSIIQDKIDGKPVADSDYPYAYTRMNYEMINVKQDLFNIGSWIVFGKIGAGMGLVTLPSLSVNENDIEAVFQGGAGIYKQLNNYFDLEFEYRAVANVGDVDTISTGQRQSIELFSNYLFVSIRYKI